jgi:hypothetical protein
MFAFLKSWKSDKAQRVLLDRASRLIEFFLKGDKKAKDEAVSSLMSAGHRVMTHMETTTTFVSMFESINPNQLGRAAEIAEGLSMNMASDADRTIGRLAEAYACLAVLCKNRLNRFSGAHDVKVAEMVAELYGAGIVRNRFRSDENGSRPCRKGPTQ